MLKEACFYTTLKGNKVQCFLCAHNCLINDGGLGLCQARQNAKGVLSPLNYGEVIACHIDPIEKKPLFHFLPGSSTYSIACPGCNFQCDFCQNWQISQIQHAGKFRSGNLMSPEEVVKQAQAHSCPSISYTYTEPTIYYEFAYECAKLAHTQGLYNIFVTNGFMSQEALAQMHGILDAANVDLKSFREDFYRSVCKAQLSPVLDTIKMMKELNIWVEITTLIIPGANDSPDELSDIARFIASLDIHMPWHISRFHPDYRRMDCAPTPQETLAMAYDIAKSCGLKNIYIGNMISDVGTHTYCSACEKPLIVREGFSIIKKHVKDGQCLFCKQMLSGFGL
jgi:pyruvate formate lyase activating enzyme